MEKTKWNVDPAHTSIGFRAKYLMLTNVRGNFGNYEVEVETDGDDFILGSFGFKAETNSISTGNAQAREHIGWGLFTSKNFKNRWICFICKIYRTSVKP